MYLLQVLITHAGDSRCVGRMISGVCDFVCVFISVCLCVCTLQGKRLELSTPNLVHTVHGSRSACTDLRSKGQKSRSRGNYTRCWRVHVIHNFLLVFHCNYILILHHFRDIIDYFPKFKEVTWPWLRLLEGLFVNRKANISHGQSVYKIWSL